MPLPDLVDRLSIIGRSLHTTAASTGTNSDTTGGLVPAGTPFTTAALSTPLGNLIRDIDPSELGLFTLVNPTGPPAAASSSSLPAQGQPKIRGGGSTPTEHQDVALSTAPPKVSRTEFHGATPLRRRHHHGQHEGKQRALGKTAVSIVVDPEPEVYALAALKYLDRYQSIRAMPRARAQAEAILEDLAIRKDNVQTLTEALEEIQASHQRPVSPKTQATNEERRIQELQFEISELKKHKEQLAKSRRLRGPARPAAATTAKTITSKSNRVPLSPSSIHASSSSPPPAVDANEEEFWTTPGRSKRGGRGGDGVVQPRALRFIEDDSMLIDERMELGDVSVMTFGMTTPSAAHGRPTGLARSLGLDTEDVGGGDAETSSAGSSAPPSPTPASAIALSSVKDDDDDDGTEDDDQDVENTPILRKQQQQQQPASPLISPSEPVSPEGVSDKDKQRSGRIRVTSDMERIVAKIWTTVGELIMPGHQYDISGMGGAGAQKPPRAKETIAYLQSLSDTPAASSSSSPSISSLSSLTGTSHASLSSTPTPQQIQTAKMILALLAAAPAGYAVPLAKLKVEALGGTTRALYACVAKKLVKIDRGGGEQIVRFDT